MNDDRRRPFLPGEDPVPRRTLEERKAIHARAKALVSLDDPMARILAMKRSEEAKERAEKILAKVEPIVREARNKKLLADRRKRIHARAKKLVPKHRSSGADKSTPGLIYKVRNDAR